MQLGRRLKNATSLTDATTTTAHRTRFLDFAVTMKSFFARACIYDPRFPSMVPFFRGMIDGWYCRVLLWLVTSL